MSLRPIDSQLSLSRTMDAGAMQSQMNQKPTLDQEAMAAQAARQAELARQRSNDVDKTPEALIRDEQSPRGGYNEQQGGTANQEQRKQSESNNESPHPYKGRFIDRSL